MLREEIMENCENYKTITFCFDRFHKREHIAVTFTVEQAMKAQRGRGQRYNSTLSLTSALDGMGGQHPHRHRSPDRPAHSDALY